MPYIAIKSFPKDDKIKKEAVKKITEIFSEAWGCPEEAVTISVEEIAPDEWEEKVVQGEIEPKMDKVMILSGKENF